MARPVSLSVKQISAAAKGSVEKALEKHKAAFPTRPDYRIGFVPPIYWWGFVIYNPLIDKVALGDAQRLATEVHDGIAGSVAAIKGGKPGVVLGDGNLTIGFAPPIEVNVYEE
jgi:hypothetical protein